MIAVTVVYVLVFVVATFASRVAVAGLADGTLSRGPLAAVLGYIANLATVVLLVWGFSVLKWYVPLGCMIVGGGAAQAALTGMPWARWQGVAPFLDGFVIAGTIVLLVWQWAL